jgi:hypothetical protein
MPNVALKVTNCVVDEEGTWITAKNVGGDMIMATFSVYKPDGTPLQYEVGFNEMEPSGVRTSKIYSMPYGGSPKLSAGNYVLKAANYGDVSFTCQ